MESKKCIKHETFKNIFSRLDALTIDVTTIKTNNRHYEEDMSKLMRKVDELITVIHDKEVAQKDKELTTSEKKSLMIKNTMYISISTLVVYILLDYIIR